MYDFALYIHFSIMCADCKYKISCVLSDSSWNQFLTADSQTNWSFKDWTSARILTTLSTEHIVSTHTYIYIESNNQIYLWYFSYGLLKKPHQQRFQFLQGRLLPRWPNGRSCGPQVTSRLRPRDTHGYFIYIYTYYAYIYIYMGHTTIFWV